jgi:hypothetical protein
MTSGVVCYVPLLKIAQTNTLGKAKNVNRGSWRGEKLLQPTEINSKKKKKRSKKRF